MMNPSQGMISTPFPLLSIPWGWGWVKVAQALKSIVGQAQGGWSLAVTCYCTLPSRVPGPLGLPATGATSHWSQHRGKDSAAHWGAWMGIETLHVPQFYSTRLFLWGIYSFISNKVWKRLSSKQAESSSWAEPGQSWRQYAKIRVWSYQVWWTECCIPYKFVCWNLTPSMMVFGALGSWVWSTPWD